jgi:hypothetical protein
MGSGALKLTAIGKRGAIITALAAALAVTLLVGTAWADHWTRRVFGPGNKLLGVGKVEHGRDFIRACDKNEDGWGVRTIYETRRVQDHVGDRNGGAEGSGCGTEGPSLGGPVLRFRVCAGPDGANTICNPRRGWVNIP